MKFIKEYWLNFVVFGVLLGCLGLVWHLNNVRTDKLQGAKEELNTNKIVVGEKIKNDFKVKDEVLTTKQWNNKKASLASKVDKQISKQLNIKNDKLGAVGEEEMSYTDLEEWFEMTSKEGCFIGLDNVSVIDWNLILEVNTKFKNSKC